MSVTDIVRFTDSQLIFWAAVNLYQFTDTEEEAFDLAKYFATHVGLQHTFPEVDDEIEGAEATTSSSKRATSSQEEQTVSASGTSEKSKPSQQEVIASTLRRAGLIK